jgi:hypothetical protein
MPSLTPTMLAAVSRIPAAACRVLRVISWVAAPCSSTAAAIAPGARHLGDARCLRQVRARREAEQLFGLAAAILALGVVYWLVRDQDRRRGAPS